MALTALSLTDFRSWPRLELAVDTGLVVLVGANGAGKTNILEAVSLLAPGRGLRGSALGEMARHAGPGGFTLSATLTDGTQLGVGTQPAQPERRVIRVNGAGATAAALAERLAVVWLSPAQDRLFSDTAGARRRFLDRLVVALEPSHARHAGRYEAAMRQRNRLLAEDSVDDAWLSGLEAAMAEHGHAVMEARLRLVTDLTDAQSAAALTDFPAATLGLSEALVNDLAERLAASRTRDRAAGRTTVGPHTHDLLVGYAAKGLAAAQSSTGEQKALLIGIVLAHAALVARRTGHAPVLLLDEVAAHLDEARRAALFARLTGQGQVWLTGTDGTTFAAAADADVRLVADGTVRPFS